MGFLKALLKYKKICIQCHNNPDGDTVASAFAVYSYLKENGRDAEIIYGGPEAIKKANIKLLISECGIPIRHSHSIPEDCELLPMVDCQYGGGNTEVFPFQNVAIIDHHMRVVEEREEYLVKSEYQSCSTLVYRLLMQEGYPVKDNEALCIALMYGLYTDTSGFTDIFGLEDIAMRVELHSGSPLFERLTKANMNVAELMIASDAMYNHYFDMENGFVIVRALRCDQTVLGVIGDFVIQVDAVYLSLSYTDAGDGYQISIRSCHENLPANEIAAWVCRDIGSGGGHRNKGGGRISSELMREKLGSEDVFDVINSRLCAYMEKHRPYS